MSRFSYEIPSDTPLRVRNRSVIAVSPDGRRFVYNTAEGLQVKSMDQLDSRLLPGTEATLGLPFFSPDGQSVGFSQSPQLKRISLSGGAPVVIAELSSRPAGANWTADGTILFADDEGIQRVPATGGSPELLVAAGEGELFDGPQLLPDNDTLLFSVAAGGRGNPDRWDSGTVTVQSLSTGERVDLIAGGSDARYIPTGHLSSTPSTTACSASPSISTVSPCSGVRCRWSRALPEPPAAEGRPLTTPSPTMARCSTCPAVAWRTVRSSGSTETAPATWSTPCHRTPTSRLVCRETMRDCSWWRTATPGFTIWRAAARAV